jgi:hypothetical protein
LVLASRAKAGSTDVPDVLDQLVTISGVPVLALPAELSVAFGQTILVGWNNSREAARSVRDALPFPHTAKRVILCAVGEEAKKGIEAAASMLERHGLSVRLLRVDEPDARAGEVLLAQAGAHERTCWSWAPTVMGGCASWCSVVPLGTYCVRPCCQCSSAVDAA